MSVSPAPPLRRSRHSAAAALVPPARRVPRTVPVLQRSCVSSTAGRIAARSASPPAPLANFREVREGNWGACDARDANEREEHQQDSIRSASSLVAAHGHIQVSACGRELELEVQDAQPLATLQTSLRRELGLPGQELDISDAHGTRIVYDSDLRAALCRGDTPLSASTADSSTARMEYRVDRNEDSGECRQTQWKLIRDEFSSLADKMLKIGRSVEELSEAVGNQRREHDAATGHLWHEINTLIETATRQSASQIFDRIDALALSVQSERAIREAMKDDLEKQLQVLQEDLEADRIHNRAEAAKAEDARQTLLAHAHADAHAQTGAREAFEDRLHQDLWRLGDRVEVIAEMQNEKARDFNEQILQASCKSGRDLQDITSQILQVRGFSQNWQTQMDIRLKTVETGSTVFENTLADAVNRQVTQFDWVHNRLEKLSMLFAEARIEEQVRERSRERSAAPLSPANAEAPATPPVPLSNVAASLAVAAAADEWQRLRRSPRAASSACAGSPASSPGPMPSSPDFAHMGASTAGIPRASGLGGSPPAPLIPSSLRPVQGLSTGLSSGLGSGIAAGVDDRGAQARILERGASS